MSARLKLLRSQTMILPDDIVIRDTLRPGDLGRIISLHGAAYIDERGHFGLPFEAYVARTIAEFMLDNGGRGRVFLAERGDRLLACAAIVERERDGETHGQLRWVLADRPARGLGLGGALVDRAIAHARASSWASVFLETTDGLDAAMGLYKKRGFIVEKRARHALWTGEDDVIFMRLALK